MTEKPCDLCNNILLGDFQSQISVKWTHVLFFSLICYMVIADIILIMWTYLNFRFIIFMQWTTSVMVIFGLGHWNVMVMLWTWMFILDLCCCSCLTRVWRFHILHNSFQFCKALFLRLQSYLTSSDYVEMLQA